MDAPSPCLPWEVMERIIGHSGGHFKTLNSLSLLCRELRPRALCLLVASVRLPSRDQNFEFYDFIQDKTHLRPLVRSIVVDLIDFAPVPLLHALPSVSDIKFTSRRWQKPVRAIHQSTLTGFKLHGNHIHTLHFSHLSFDMFTPLARLLLAFTNLAHLYCTNIEIQNTVTGTGNHSQLGLGGHQTFLQHRLYKQLHLKTLAFAPVIGELDNRVLRILIPSGSYTSSLVSLSIWIFLPPTETAGSTQDAGGSKPSSHLQHLLLLLKKPNWSQLQSLVLRISYISIAMFHDYDLVKFFEDIHAQRLTEVVVEVQSTTACSILDLRAVLLPRIRHSHDASAFGLENQELDQITPLKLRFGCLSNQLSPPDGSLKQATRTRKILWILRKLRPNRKSFWNWVLRTQFPKLTQGSRLLVTADKDETVLPGHETSIRVLVISPDGMWVASGSDDSTIILWDTKGKILRQWIAHTGKPVYSLAFSPDSQYLISGGEDNKMALWYLDRDACKATINLTAHAKLIEWLPKGNIIATALWDGTVQLLDARTFRRIHVLLEGQDTVGLGHPWSMPVVARSCHCLAFSPDGCWLVFGLAGNYCIHHVQSGTLHQYIQGQVHNGRMTSNAAAFDCTSTRFAHTSGSDVVEIWHIESKKRLYYLRYPSLVNDVSFSPDGRLVLAALLNGTVCVHDAHAANQAFLLAGHKDRVAKARFSPCGTYIVSASWDRTVKVWRTSGGSHVTTLSEHDDQVEHLVLSLDGKILASGGLYGTVIIRRMSDIVDL